MAASLPSTRLASGRLPPCRLPRALARARAGRLAPQKQSHALRGQTEPVGQQRDLLFPLLERRGPGHDAPHLLEDPHPAVRRRGVSPGQRLAELEAQQRDLARRDLGHGLAAPRRPPRRPGPCRPGSTATMGRSEWPRASWPERSMASVPARSASNMKVTFLVKRIISPIWASVSAVPMEATTLPVPAWASASTSV